MGVLEEIDGERRVQLRATTVVGRSRRADLRIPHEVVSGLHAEIRFDRGHWSVKDLASHNGTLVGGHRIPSGESVRLGRSDEIWFGDEKVAWCLAEAGPPLALALGPGGEAIEGDHGILFIESTTGRSITVYRTALGTWRIESEDATGPIHDGDTISVDGRDLVLVLPEVHVPTRTNDDAGPLLLSTIRLCFDGSPRASLSIHRAQRVIEVGAGPHVDLLLALARVRVDGEGWRSRDELTTELGMSVNHLNVVIHRARRHLAELGVEGAAGVVERRRGELRLGCTDVVLH